MERDNGEVMSHMLAETSRITGLDLEHARHRVLHRWRYANTPRQEGPESLVDRDRQLAACGDWCIHGRVEAAYLSGVDTARQISERL